ncbi:MAG: pilus assembly PilX family protein [Burkholderiaceae bacterium]
MALFTVLVFMLVLTVLGLVAIRGATVGERLARNRVDREIAMQAAEAALRDAEKDVSNFRPGSEHFGGATGNCEQGQCYRLPTNYFTTPVWEDPDMWNNGVDYGRYTGAPPLASVSQQPKYLIEGFRKNEKWVYRISALGYGTDSNTRVVLQSIYKPY